MRDGPLHSDVGLAIEGLSLTLGTFALRNLNFSVAPGEIGVILGPNGAGKSVTLETIAGFHSPEAGRVLIGNRDVTDLPPEQRRAAFILQNFGLFPHLTVAQNVAFGLAARRGRTHSDLRAILARFRLEPLAEARPATLSPGEKQRVALARSLVTDPDVFLLDEPFAAIDPRTSESLREELARFIREARIPALFVTHDHIDALTLADKVAVMAGGEIVQAGASADLFHRPKTRFVAEFLGIENILHATVVARHAAACTVAIGETRLDVPAGNDPPPVGAAVTVCARAEAIDVRRRDSSGGRGLPGTIVAMSNAGPLHRIVLDCGFPLIASLLPRTVRERELVPDLNIVADIDPAAIHLIAER